MSSPQAEIVAWAVFPAAFLVTNLGLGLLVARLAGIRLPGPLLVPVGLCASIVVVMPGYALGVDNRLAVALIVALTAAGFLTRRRRLRATVAEAFRGPWSLAAFVVVACYVAPAVLTGRWTWTGYNFVNDTAVQFLLTDWLAGHGIPFHAPLSDTTLAVTYQYLATFYPVGAHAYMATMQGLLGTPVAVFYQTFLGLLMGTAALALFQLASRAGLSAWPAAIAAALAPLAILAYQYGLQGNVKELLMATTLISAAAVGRELIGADSPVRWGLCLSVCLAAALEAFAGAGIPFVLALAGCLLVAAVLARAPFDRRRLPVAALATLAGVLVLALPTLVTIVRSLQNLKGGFSAGGGTSPQLGQLVRPLPLSEASGVWLTGDYRFPISGGAALLLTTAGAVLVGVLIAAAVWALGRRREFGPLILFGALALTAAVVSPRTSPYAGGKLLAILSPGVLFLALVGGFALRGRLRPAGAALAAVVAGLVLTSAAMAYHDTRLAPTSRMRDLQAVGDRFAGRGLMLFNEFEQFGMYFARRAHIDTPTDAVTPIFIRLRGGNNGFQFKTYDLDEQDPSFVEQFPYIILRRGPATSRPPANFRLVYQNASYSVWKRFRGTRVLYHFPAGTTIAAASTPACASIRAVAAAAKPGEALVAATPPASGTWNVVTAPSKPLWPTDPERPGLLFMPVPGFADGHLAVPAAGRYRVWVQGSFGRPLQVYVDGRRVGRVLGTNTPGAWLSAGIVSVAAGRHTIRILRGGGGLAPGDGSRSSVGPVTLQALGAERLIRVSPHQAGRLCGRPLDWLERVSGGGPAS